MKNKVFAFASLVAVALSACQEEPKEQGSKEIKATISAEGLSWSSSDAIGLYEKKDPVKFSLSGGEGSATGTFTSSSSSEATIAVYPYDSNLSYGGGGFTINLPDSYQGKAIFPLFGRKTGSIFNMKPVTAILKVGGNISYSGVSKLVVDAPGKKVSGSFTFTLGDPKVKTSASSSGGTVTMNGAFAQGADFSYMIPIPAGVYENLVFTLYDSSGEKLGDYTEKGITLEAGQVFTKTIRSEGSVDPRTLPEQKLLFVNESQIGLVWSNNGFSNVAEDISHPYIAAIYSDSGCKTLLWAWHITEGGATGAIQSVYSWDGGDGGHKFQPGIVFNGLKPETQYYVKISDTKTGTATVNTYTTTASTNVDKTSGNVSEGDVILSEDFSEFLYGGSPYGLPGYKSSTQALEAAAVLPAGDDPQTSTGGKQALCPPKEDFTIFSTLFKAFSESRVKDWRGFVQNNIMTSISVQSGVVKIGGGNYTGDFVTPALNCLKKTATLKITFDAAPYIEWGATPLSDGNKCVVEVFPENLTVVNRTMVSCGTSSNEPLSSEIVQIGSEPGFKSYSVIVNNVPSGGSIGIGPFMSNDPGRSESRCYIDNIKIELVKYEDTSHPHYDSINGTVILEGNNGIGLITDSKTGKGIEGVPVTDGYNYTATDANGVYQMKLDRRTRYVCMSVPAAYKIPLDEYNHAPRFYSVGKFDMAVQNRNDFVLEPLDAPEKEFTLVMIGDPQCQTSKGVGYFTTKHGNYPGTIPDIQATVNEGLSSGEYKNVYAMTLGDIVFDSSNMWYSMQRAMSNVRIDSGWLPFFQCIGNHDHTATVTSDDPSMIDYLSSELFVKHFGPTDYSFDRGDAHIVVMDNVYAAYSTPHSSYPDGATMVYNGGFTDEQLEWFKKDLSYVKDKDKKMLIFCAHIPFREGANYITGSMVILFAHHHDFLDEMKAFHSAELMIGHVHYPGVYIHRDWVTGSGRPIMEHLHQAACGGWWNCHSSVTGGPNGYTIYKVNGPDIVDWINKGTGRSKDYQVRVYDGNQTYSGTRKYQFTWAAGGVGGTSNIPAYGHSPLEGCFVAEVWDDDSDWWTVEMYQNGKKIGDFERVPDGVMSNVALASYAFNELGKNSVSWTDRAFSHYWFFRPASGIPAAETGWEVRVTHTIPSSGIKHVFTRNTFTTDYSEF